MIVQGINFILMAIGAFWFYPRFIGTILNFCCACCFGLSAWSAALAAAVNPIGRWCSMNVAPTTYEGGYSTGSMLGDMMAGQKSYLQYWNDKTTYKTDHGLLISLAVV